MFLPYRPNLESVAVDELTIEWENMKSFTLTPFVCIPRILQITWRNNVVGILIVLTEQMRYGIVYIK